MSTTDIPKPMVLSAFMQKRAKYVEAARARITERIDSQLADTPHPIQVVEEMMMDILNRIEALEAILAPPDEA